MGWFRRSRCQSRCRPLLGLVPHLTTQRPRAGWVLASFHSHDAGRVGELSHELQSIPQQTMKRKHYARKEKHAKHLPHCVLELVVVPLVGAAYGAGLSGEGAAPPAGLHGRVHRGAGAAAQFLPHLKVRVSAGRHHQTCVTCVKLHLCSSAPRNPAPIPNKRQCGVPGTAPDIVPTYLNSTQLNSTHIFDTVACIHFIIVSQIMPTIGAKVLNTCVVAPLVTCQSSYVTYRILLSQGPFAIIKLSSRQY